MTASAVARLWADRLESGKIDNFYRVPSKLQNDVREILYNDGYEILEDGTVVKRDEWKSIKWYWYYICTELYYWFKESWFKYISRWFITNE